MAAVTSGESFEIRRILFDRLRSVCAQLDLHEGDVVHCRAGGTAQLVLVTAAGRTVILERDWARYITVAGRTARWRGPAR